MLVALAAALTTVGPLPVATAQLSPRDQLTAARAQMQSRTFDSAAALLRNVTTDSTATASERAEAWIWLGLVRYYLGDDSAAARAFRTALALDPKIGAAGLARVDPVLEEMFRAARIAAGWCSDESPCSTVTVERPPPSASVHSCVPKCERGVRRPVLLRVPPFIDPDVGASALFTPEGAPGFVLVEGTVNKFGRIEPGSVRVVTATTAATRRVVEYMLVGAEFKPGTLEGLPVPVIVQLRYECHREGTGATCYFR